MEAFLSEPVVVLLSVVLVAAFVLLEVALPTGGLASAVAAGLGLVALVAIVVQEATWWPLLFGLLGVSWWSVMLACRRASVAGQGIALALFGSGLFGFALLAHDVQSLVASVLATAGAAVAFPIGLAHTKRFFEQPGFVGAESLVGGRGVVVAWREGSGSVRLGGSLWTASADRPLQAGADVRVVATEGTSLVVAAVPRHGSD